MTEETGTEISEAMDNDFKYSKDDICKICGVSERTFRSFLAMQPLSQQDFTSIGPRNKHSAQNLDIIGKALFMKNNMQK